MSPDTVPGIVQPQTYQLDAAKPSVSLVLPTYNERENIQRLVPQLARAFDGYTYEILVVDDSSPDGTGAAVQELAQIYPVVRLITRARKEGIGAALREGYDQARHEVIVSSDVDLSFQPSDLVRLVEVVTQGSDLALGSRHTSGSHYEAPTASIRRKRWISRVGNRVLRWTFGIPIHDFSANCRAIRRTTWRRIETRENTNTLLLEMILRCHFGGLRVTELPVTFLDRRYGVSKLRLSIEAPKFLVKMLWYRLSFWRRSGRQ